MITKVTGQLIALHEDVLTLKVGAFEYEVRIPEFTRRQLQGELNCDISLHTIEYLEGNPMQGRMTPRLIGFTSEAEREFFADRMVDVATISRSREMGLVARKTVTRLHSLSQYRRAALKYFEKRIKS